MIQNLSFIGAFSENDVHRNFDHLLPSLESSPFILAQEPLFLLNPNPVIASTCHHLRDQLKFRIFSACKLLGYCIYLFCS